MDKRFRDILRITTKLEVLALLLHPEFRDLKLEYAGLNDALDKAEVFEDRLALKNELGCMVEETEEMLADRFLPRVWAFDLLGAKGSEEETAEALVRDVEIEPVREVGTFDFRGLWEMVEPLLGGDVSKVLTFRQWMFSQMVKGAVAVPRDDRLLLGVDPRLPPQVLRKEIEKKVLEYQKKRMGGPLSGRLKLWGVPPEELEARVRLVLRAYKLRAEGASFPQIAEALGLPGGREDPKNFLTARRLVLRGQRLVEDGVFATLFGDRFFYKLPVVIEDQL